MSNRDPQLPDGYLKADLHCHTYHSGLTGHMTAFEPMDSYSSPQRLYDLAKKRGMDLVTITDHDSIDGCLAFLDSHPGVSDFFTGEEVTVAVPEFNTTVHVAVYDITEEQHNEITYRKKDFEATLNYLREQGIIHVLNHLFHEFPSRGSGKKFLEKMLSSFVLFEGINGAIDEGHNQITQRLSDFFPGKSLIAGSDSHTLLRLGSCYTACKATGKSEYLQQLRNGKTLIGGQYGHFHHRFNDAMGVYLNYFRDLVFRREVHINWPLWKEVRNALGWIVCLPVFFGGALSGLLIRQWIEQFRQKDYEAFISELSGPSSSSSHFFNAKIAERGLS
jgi:predicted metal-dependent phosphoesterase TrpH